MSESASFDPAFLNAAARIADRLCRDALWAGNECNWLGWAMTPIGSTWTLAYRAQPPALYDGTAGIAMFLARLFEITNDPVIKVTALGALNRSIRGVDALGAQLTPAFYTGLLGIAYTCIELGHIFEDDRIAAKGSAWLDGLRGLGTCDYGFDICAGSAGAIQALINLSCRYGYQDLIDMAVAHGQHLLETANRSAEGWSWDTMPGVSRNLLGYAHGTAGIATGLLELWRVTSDDRFREAALCAIHYERSHFDQSCGNWPDFRTVDTTKSPPSPSFMLAWCHGAPGIGLSRIRAYELLKDDPLLTNEIQVALQTTATHFAASLANGHGNYSLCHGAGGNAELFILASRIFLRPDLLQIAETVGRNGIVQYHESPRPWPCGVAVGVETPNLMLGLAGIGYYYLRLYDPDRVPSILLLTPSSNGSAIAQRSS
jgi:type 2 lantibiotic biosynthesis protein LanM